MAIFRLIPKKVLLFAVLTVVAAAAIAYYLSRDRHERLQQSALAWVTECAPGAIQVKAPLTDSELESAVIYLERKGAKPPVTCEQRGAILMRILYLREHRPSALRELLAKVDTK